MIGSSGSQVYKSYLRARTAAIELFEELSISLIKHMGCFSFVQKD